MTSAEMTEKFIKLAYKIASPYCRGFPAYKKDILGAARLGLCEGIKKVQEKEAYDHAGAIIFLNVRRRVLDEIRKIPIIPIPSSLVKKRKLEAYEQKKEFRVMDLYPEVYNDPLMTISCQVGVEVHSEQVFQEYFEWLKLTDFEERVLRCRLEEQTVREIADELGCSSNWIQKTIERIRDKWRKRKRMGM